MFNNQRMFTHVITFDLAKRSQEHRSRNINMPYPLRVIWKENRGRRLEKQTRDFDPAERTNQANRSMSSGSKLMWPHGYFPRAAGPLVPKSRCL
jgi:hypothetical protein